MGIVIVSEVVAVFMAYMVINVPLVGPMLTREETLRHWPAAAIGALVVAIGVFLVVRETQHARRASPSPEIQGADAEVERPRVPRSLRFERVPGRAVAIAAALSLATVPLSFGLGASFQLGWLAFLAPWIPLVALEAQWKRTRDTFFTGFALIAILQLLHMVEHSVQVGQLLASGGSLARSHGIFGQLDFELVHFVTDTILWISLGVLMISFKGRNLWLYVAFVAASLHQIEHFYLFWLYHADNNLYLSGGFAGIMGKGGLIGSPLDRPYLHYTYNFIVFVPMVIALWDEARRVDRHHPRRADPRSAAASPLGGDVTY
ncbi:MAG: hypothetical protein M3481_12450 [Actinomycetota bacterium]|nr:hypothetical protein [Actinomycetota bacterium]